MNIFASYIHGYLMYLGVTDLVSNHCYNYREYILAGVVVIIGATCGPVPIKLGDF